MISDNRSPNQNTVQADEPKRDDDKKVTGVPGEHDKKESREGGDQSQVSQR